VRSRLRRRLFVWFGVSILLSGLVAGVVAWSTSSGASRWQRQMEGVERFLGQRFAEVWDDPPRRDALARELGQELGVDVTLVSARGGELASFGARCASPDGRAEVARDGRRLGEVRVCFDGGPPHGHLRILAASRAGSRARSIRS
jgi:hypothetical protein